MILVHQSWLWLPPGERFPATQQLAKPPNSGTGAENCYLLPSSIIIIRIIINNNRLTNNIVITASFICSHNYYVAEDGSILISLPTVQCLLTGVGQGRQTGQLPPRPRAQRRPRQRVHYTSLRTGGITRGRTQSIVSFQ